MLNRRVPVLFYYTKCKATEHSASATDYKPLKHQAKFVANDILFIIIIIIIPERTSLSSSRESSAPADDSHEMSRLVFSEKNKRIKTTLMKIKNEKKKKKEKQLSSAAAAIGAFIFYFIFCFVCRPSGR